MFECFGGLDAPLGDLTERGYVAWGSLGPRCCIRRGHRFGRAGGVSPLIERPSVGGFIRGLTPPARRVGALLVN